MLKISSDAEKSVGITANTVAQPNQPLQKLLSIRLDNRIVVLAVITPRQGPKSVGNLQPSTQKFFLILFFYCILTKEFFLCSNPPKSDPLPSFPTYGRYTNWLFGVGAYF